jgi:4-hydroxybenzoyl-CoA reductase subunit beta
MLRMDGFDYAHATSPEEAVRLFAAAEAQEGGSVRYIAGGTDILPNLKHRIISPTLMIGIATALPQDIEDRGEYWEIGAGMRLSTLAACDQLPALSLAASLIAGPQIRNMGTLGGNIFLDTRCLFFNQSEFWRSSLGGCLKAQLPPPGGAAEGAQRSDWCHVINGPKTCVATQSSDTVPVLLVRDASIVLLGPEGERVLALRNLFRFNGMDHLKIEAGELITHVRVPRAPKHQRESYQKLRTRDSIDFPQLGLAISAQVEGTGEGAILHGLELVVGAVNPQPKQVKKLDAFVGQPLTNAAIAQIAELVVKQTRPQAAVHGGDAWRRHMAGVFTRRGLTGLRDRVG